MAVLEILHYPNPVLKEKSQTIQKIDVSIRKLVQDLAETMYSAPGVGLAANQVGCPLRLAVIDVTPHDQPKKLLVLINPEIVTREGEQECEEGCLSVPGVYDVVKRAEKVKVRALDGAGQPYELVAEGLLAVCIQHEMDHLEGKVFVEYLSRLKQARIRSKLQKQERQSA